VAEVSDVAQVGARPGRADGRSGATRWVLRLIAVGYVTILVVLPLGVMIMRTFSDGIGAFVESVTSPEAVTAITLSVEVAIQAVAVNTIFGIAVSLLLTRYRFRGRGVLNALIDLPVSVSPVIARVRRPGR
jgi:sulfate transport system permease protein